MFRVYKSRILLLACLSAIGGCTATPDPDGSPSSSSQVTSQPVPSSSSSVPVSSSSSQATQSSVGSSDHPGKVLYDRASADGGCVACHGPNGDHNLAQSFKFDLRPSVKGTGNNPFVSYTATNMPFGLDVSTCDLNCAESIKSWLVDEIGFDDAPQTPSSQSVSSVASSSASSQDEVEEDVRFVSMLAVNVGGAEFESREAINFVADQGSAGGDTSNQAEVVGDILSTDDDTLFHTERWGAFSYSFDVPNGLYAVEFGLIELVHTHTAGSRVFNIAIEGNVELQGIDIVAETGKHYLPLTKEVEHIEVTDGALNIAFQQQVHNPTVSFINVKRVEETPDKFKRLCSSCHGGPNGEGRSGLGDSLVSGRCDACSAGLEPLASYITSQMPFMAAESCTGKCAQEMANYILDNFAGYNGNPAVVLEDFLDHAGDVGACGVPDVPFNHLRRVTKYDYNRMVADLLGVSGNFSKGLGSDEQVGSFSINGKRLPEINQVIQYFKVATTVSDEAIKNKSTWMPCSATSDSCAEQTIEKLGLKAFRRPLTSQEKADLVDVYRKAKTAEGAASSVTEAFDRGLATAVAAILASPNFLYYIESGEGNGNVVALNQYELAARLALFIWRSLPDDALLNAAKNSQLSTDAQLKAQAERMLQDSRARDVVGLFHKEWMNIAEPRAGLADFEAQRAAMDGFEKTIQSLVFDENAGYSNLFTVDYDYLNGESKALYEVSGNPIAGQSSDGLDKYNVGARRIGILSRAPFLRSNYSPVTRGLFLRKEVFCGVIPQPPPTAAEEAQAVDNALNPRQIFDIHTNDPGCAGCHALMDPLGFPLDNFDPSGRWRSNYGFENNFVVDAAGEFVRTDIDGRFNGPTEMQQGIATSQDVQQCYTLKWFEFAAGRRADNADTCSLGQVNERVYASGSGSILDLITSIVTSDAFRNRRTEL